MHTNEVEETIQILLFFGGTAFSAAGAFLACTATNLNQLAQGIIIAIVSCILVELAERRMKCF